MLVSNRSTNILLVLILAVGIGIAAMFASGARGGPLDPAGAPASSMHTLEDSPVVWNRALAANDGPDSCHSSRFLCVLSNDAVLDRETGLVWQRVVSTAKDAWAAQLFACQTAMIGGRYGWRTPRYEELTSLLDGATGNLPMGHPFANVLPEIGDFLNFYWSSSTAPEDQSRARVITFPLNPGIGPFLKNAFNLEWCVRGGAGLEGM